MSDAGGKMDGPCAVQRIWSQGCVRGGGRSGFLAACSTCQSPISWDKGLCTRYAEAVGSAINSGFEPAKALIRWLPLPRPRVLPSPVRGLPLATEGVSLCGMTLDGVVC